MSGIYIPGLRVPEENEDELWLAVRSDGTVTFNAEYGWTTNKGKAVPVQPHGRLIDADVLEVELEKAWNERDDETFANHSSWKALHTAPTIIPADPADKEGEG